MVTNCTVPLDVHDSQQVKVWSYNVNRERQRDGALYRIVSVIADVSRAWHDAAAYLIYHVHTDARRGR